MDYKCFPISLYQWDFFVIQKLLINNERNQNIKKDKDLDAIKYVLGFVKASNKYRKELEESLFTYSKTWKK